MGFSSTPTICGCGVMVINNTVSKKRHAIEMALMGKGDVINGTVIFGMAPSLAVIARTPVSDRRSRKD